jgi:hypothetical protein
MVIMIFTYLYNTIQKIVQTIITISCEKKYIYPFKQEQILNITENKTTVTEPVKLNIRPNTSPNLLINKEMFKNKVKSSAYLNVLNNDNFSQYEPNWYCAYCKKKLLAYGTIYCCYDNILCSSNCRDRFLNYFRLNNNI